jgi:hypothetical protein
MSIHISNSSIEKLLNEITQITGESPTEAVHKALEERRHRLTTRTTTHDDAELLSFLQKEVWSQIPTDQQGVRLTKEEEERILGYGEQGA